MQLVLVIVGVLALTCRYGSAHEAKDFDDSILYKIDFEVPYDLDEENFASRYHISTFHTHDKEEYKCAIPIAEETQEEKTTAYSGLSPMQLIQPMFSSISCSYRIEAYWSYEICHGFHIKQYHEEREGKNVKIQEYYLGRWNGEKQEKLIQKLATDQMEGVKFKTVKIDNVQYPYLELDMGNGTLCDLNNEPRSTKIRYVCYPNGKNAIYSFKETSTCNYEAIILTSHLCIHSAFMPEESKEISIKCFNSLSNVKKPLSVVKQALDDLQMTDLSTKINIFNDIGDLKKMLEALSPAQVPFAPVEDNAGSPPMVWGEETELTKRKWDEISYVTGREDYKSLHDFLFENCFVGGSGWWKYEFCFGRHVRQFHKDKKSETQVILGYFNENTHRDWLKSHPAKRLRRKPTDSDTTIWHHYEAGSTCDKTGRLRETDVKLMCVVSSSMSTVSMYLLEPKTCQYILVVESPLVCAMLPMVDEDGLVSKTNFKNFLFSMMKKNRDESDIENHIEKQSLEKEEPTSAAVESDPPSHEGTATLEHLEVRYEND